MKSLVVVVFLLLFVLVEVKCCDEGCLKQEKEAVTSIMSQGRLPNSYCEVPVAIPKCSILSHDNDYCEWEGVECNTITGRVTKLELDSFNGQLNYSDFINFKDLKTLDMTLSQGSNCVGTLQGLKNLEVLDLSYNYDSPGYDKDATNILSCLDGLSSLKSLSLDSTVFNSTIVFQTVLETISSKLLHLEVLDISGNDLTNEILPSLKGFTYLKELYLNRTGLDSNLHFQGLCAILKNLETLDISENNFNDTDIPSALSCLSSLKSLNLQQNGLTLSSIHNISKLRSLEILDLSDNNLNLLPLENNGFTWPSSLQVLVLSRNNLSSKNIISSLNGLPRLRSLDLSYNNFTNDIVSSLNGLPRLRSLDLSCNNFTNDIVSSLNGLLHLKSLDLSGTNLEGSLDISGLLTLTSLESLSLVGNQIVNFVVHKGSKNLSRLDILALDNNIINGSNIQESLQAFPYIRHLSLTGNIFTGTVLAKGFSGLSNLEYLSLDTSSNLQNEFFKSIGDLPSLKVLSVSRSEIKGTLPIGDWYKLKKLEELDLSVNNFVGKLPSSFVNMTSLRTLALNGNHFIGDIGPNLANFNLLESLNFEENQFEFPVSFAPFSNNSNLKFIYGNGNKVILDSHSTLKTWVPKFQLQVLQLSSITQAKFIPLPNFLVYQYNLTYVDFTGCKLRGEFPNWLLENNTKVKELILKNCSFIGDFQLPSRPHINVVRNINVVRIDVSNNAITCQTLSNNPIQKKKTLSNNISSILPRLIELNMSNNAIDGSILYELSRLTSLDVLDLSDNHLSGEIPYNLFRYGSTLRVLILSNNMLHGNIPPMLSMPSTLESLFLDGNSLSGSIPSNFFNSSIIGNLDMSNNHFIGKIPSQINCSRLLQLSMSNNQFEGSIPSALTTLESNIYLDLSQNNLTGCIPSFGNSSSINFIHLSNNKLSCFSKNMFPRSQPVTLDLNNNEIENGIHDLMNDLRYTGLYILLMKGNRLTGNIPENLCQLTNLIILDLSYNDFVGKIPSCLGEMSFENKDPDELRSLFNGDTQIEDNNKIDLDGGGKDYTLHNFGKETVNFTSKKRSETYTTNVLVLMSGIDLSHNKLNGSIPSQLGNLTRIQALNLSNNFFTGKIPATFSNLVQVESLDLSFNMLSGQIPPRLSGLTSVEVFSVAHNNLSGATPDRKGQFITFDESSYEGNQFLCGPPLPKSCNPNGQTPTTPNGLNKDEENDSWVDMYVFLVSFAVAYASILSVLATVLYINPYWRRAWFYYIGLVGMNCYYFIVDNLCKLF